MSVAVEEKKDPGAKFRSAVDEQITQATGRIRAHDLIFGGLTLAAFVAVYVAAMIVTDKYLNLAEWIRQLVFGCFLLAVAAISYWLIVRPLRKRINPLYAASRVEKTIDDPKNSITGYVEAQENGAVHVAVKTAMGAKAARAVGEADVNRAVDHRSLIVAGGMLVAVLLTLVVLFFVFRPSQFSSLVGRAIYPFSSDPIAKRTEIQLLKPAPADPTITTGQTITVAVHIGGKAPRKNSPHRVRILLRHNLADPNFEEIAMDEGETSRDWQAKVPDYLVQNGFWYKVAAGDNETPEYRVSVRTLPMFEQYEASYEYPAYTRKRPDKATGPGLRAYKGTKIALVAKTNRDVKDGMLRFAAANLEPVAGKVVPGRPDALEFQFTATAASPYKLNMTPLGGDKNVDSPTFALAIDSDLAPLVQIARPEEAETTAPANGQLQVDGTVGDDFGIDKVRLRLRVGGRDLAPVPYMEGKSFLRASDNTWPTDLTFKMSADLSRLKYTDGTRFEPRFGTEKPPVIEYWVEAIDNCTETRPVADWNNQVGNVGRSPVKQLRLIPPEMEPEKKQQLDDQKQDRGTEEKQHNQEQQKKLDNEDRKKPDQQGGGQSKKDEPREPKEGVEPPKHDDETKKGGEPKKDDGSKKSGEPKKDGTQPKNMDSTGRGGNTDPMNPPKGKEADKKPTDPKQPSGGNPDMGMNTDPGNKSPEPKNGMLEPKKGMNEAGMGGTTGMQEPSGQPPMAPMPQSPEEKRAQEEAKRDAEKVQKELDKNKAPGGDAKPNPTANAEQNRTEPAQPKPQAPPDGMGMQPEPKPEPKNDGAKPMPMGGDSGSPSQSKPEGKPEDKPNPDSAAKPGPQQGKDDPKKPMDKSKQTSESRGAPLGGAPGEEKPEPAGEQTTDPKAPKEPNKDPMSGSSGKPATAKPEPKMGEMGDMSEPTQPGMPPEPKSDPVGNAAQPKPNADPAPGRDKETPEPKGGRSGAEKPKADPKAGDAKPKQAPPSAQNKPMPKMGDAATEPQPSNDKPAPDMTKSERASEPKPDAAKQPTSGAGGASEKPVERGEEKPSDQPMGGNDAKKKAGGEKKDMKDGKGGKLDDAKQKELDQAVKDLTDPDPKKQQAARDKLDKEVGKGAREIIEQGQKEKKAELDQLQKDLDSPDKSTREAAEKKLKDLQDQARKEAEKRGDGRKLSEQELKDLTDKARDLNSKDDAKRKAAEKALDDKLGKESREKLQKELKKREDDFNKPFGEKEKDDLQRKIDEAAKNTPGVGKGPITKHANTPGASSEPPLPAMEDDPRNRAKSAQLQLEEFEKHRYDRDLLDRLQWTDDDYKKFLDGQRKRAEELQKEADDFEKAQLDKPKPPLGIPTIATGGAGKVEGREPGAKIEGSGARTVVAPPGFGNARERFLQPKPKPKR